MARAPPFSSLPYEIVSQICQQPGLDKDDLVALRLTCKSYGVHDAATTSLGKLFEDITVLFSEHSFNMLVNICKHPVFSHCIKSVKLSSIRCNKYERLDMIVQALQREDASVVASARLEARSKHLNDLSVRIRSYVSRTQDEDEFARSTKPTKLLIRALQFLTQAGGRIVPGITVREINSLGCGRVLHVEKLSSCLWYDASSSTLKLLDTAVSRCKLSFTELSLDIIAAGWPYSQWMRRIPNGSTTVDLVLQAESLDLGLFCSQGLSIDQGIAQFIQQDISKSTQIRSLRVVGVDTVDRLLSASSQSLLQFWAPIPSLFLESFSLVGILTTIPDLIAFLAKIQGTLRYLSIVSCELNTTSWIPALDYIKDHLTALDELHLAQNMVDSGLSFFMLLDESEYQRIKHEERLLACLDAHGQSDIQSSLAEVLASCESFAPIPNSANEIGDEYS
ncbi:hypothetical protein KCU78_g3717, partial [Aureobasidium melanogenum]